MFVQTFLYQQDGGVLRPRQPEESRSREHCHNELMRQNTLHIVMLICECAQCIDCLECVEAMLVVSIWGWAELLHNTFMMLCYANYIQER